MRGSREAMGAQTVFSTLSLEGGFRLHNAASFDLKGLTKDLLLYCRPTGIRLSCLKMKK